MNKLPLNDPIAFAIARLVDDSQVDTREPSHSDIEELFKRANLLNADPRLKGSNVGKAKRVRAVLTWAIDNNVEAGEKLVYLLLSTIKSLGGFRETSPNFVGEEAILNMMAVLKEEGYFLSKDGNLSRAILENINNIEREKALRAYARRAKRGIDDAALLTGTSKDLLEAVAAHIIQEKWGTYPSQSNFPTLLGQAYTALGLVTTNESIQPNEPAQYRVHRALYELACSINKLRNKEGTGHGRPFLPNVTDDEAQLAIESMGVISEYLLSKL